MSEGSNRRTKPETPGAVPAGTRIGPYTLEHALGGGGMGVVYRARDPEGQIVALKVLRAAFASPEAKRRFAREALLRIDHPNVVRVLDAGVDDTGAPYIVFELLTGESLEARLERGRLRTAEAIEIAVAACRGLAAAHAQGIVHRDLKPPNLFLCEDGTIKLLDFGIARTDAQATRLTATGNVVGTPSYLSPEQACGDPSLDVRTDIWSIGVVLYEALAGRGPFDRDTTLATMLAVLMEPAPPLAVAAPGTPRALTTIVDRCLAKKREERFPTIDALREALEAIDPSQRETIVDGPIAEPSDQTTPVAKVARSITPGEQRLVAVLLAEGVTDARAIRSAVELRAGVLIPLAGARAIGLFGGEAWEGDEVERAIAAALASRVGAARIAVASGRASYSGSTGIAGSALKAAEAGCAAKLAGVAIDAETARAVRGAYLVRPVDAGIFELASSTPMGPPPSVAPPEGAPLLAREAESAQMRRAIEIVLEERRAEAVVVTGPPGIGKSRLALELRRMLDTSPARVRVLAGRAEPLKKDAALSLVGSVVSSWASRNVAEGRLPRLDPTAPLDERRTALRMLTEEAMGPGPSARESADFFGELLGIPMPETGPLAAARRDPQLMVDRLRLAVQDYCAALCARGPVAVILEDLQWADAASLDLLEDLLDRLHDAPLLVFATARPELDEIRPGFLDPHGAERIEPRGLGPSHVAALAESILGRPIPDALARDLTERTAGNPLFVEQILLAARDAGGSEADLAASPLPMTVEAAVQSRLDHLPPHEKDLCKRASIFRRAFAVSEVEALGVVGGESLLSSLGRRDLIARRARTGASGGMREYQFRSRLVAEVAYRMMADILRRELHRRAASFLTALPHADPEELAMHHELGEELERAAASYVRAALGAARFGDAQTVLRCTGRALELGAPAASMFALQMARSEAFELLGRLDEQSGALAAALSAATSDAEKARALTDQAVWLWRRARSDEAASIAASAVEAARRGSDPESLAMARGRQGAILTYMGRFPEAGEALREAEQLAVSAAPQVRPLAAVWRAQLASALGDLGARRDAYRLAVELYTEAGDLRRAAGAEMNLADAYNRVGAYAEAEAALRDALDKCRRVGNKLMEGYALLNLGYALTMEGKREEALAALGDAAELAAAVGEARLAAFVRVYRARALLPSTPAEAAFEAKAAAREAEERDLLALSALALTTLARARLAIGDPTRALAASTRAMELRDQLGSIEEDEAEVFLAHAAALRAAGRVAEASDVLVRGRSRLSYIARRIADTDWRQRFLRDVAAHRELG